VLEEDFRGGVDDRSRTFRRSSSSLVRITAFEGTGAETILLVVFAILGLIPKSDSSTVEPWATLWYLGVFLSILLLAFKTKLLLEKCNGHIFKG
jgi:hypothetical protein